MAESNSIMPQMDWSSHDIVNTFEMFKQQCELYFSVKDIKKQKQVDNILLLSGREGITKYNSWGLSGEEAKNPEKVWQKFGEQIKPKTNFRVARLFLQKFKQNPTENIDEYVSRLKLHAKKCDFAEGDEYKERLIEQMIAGTRHTELQKELLSKNKDLTLDQALEHGRTHEASIDHMKQLAEAQGTSSEQTVHSVQQASYKPCRRCGRSHPPKPREKCPAHGTTCENCGKPNHWKAVCQSEAQKLRGQQNRQPLYDRQPQPAPSKNTYRAQDRKNYRRRKVHAVAQEDTSDEDSDFECVSFSQITVDSVTQDTRDEVFAHINIQIPEKPHIPAELKVKVDTGAQGNLLPLRIFRQMCPARTDLLTHSQTILTAYNGTKIPQCGTLKLNCCYGDGTWHTAEFYVAKTDGPAILGLPSSRNLRLVTLHCELQVENQPLNSVRDLLQTYPEQFDCVGNFPGEYHIVIDESAKPVIHAPRKCPIHMKEEVKSELDKMTQQGIIKKVDKLTDWVSSLAYSRKSNGQL